MMVFCTGNISFDSLVDFLRGKMFESLTDEQKARMTVHKDVRDICRETSHNVGMEVHNHAMELIAELAWKKLQVFGADLEAFAKHAKRSTINVEDVKLLVRRNPSLKAHITKLAETNVSALNSKETKRKRGTQGGGQAKISNNPINNFLSVQSDTSKTKKDANASNEVAGSSTTNSVVSSSSIVPQPGTSAQPSDGAQTDSNLNVSNFDGAEDGSDEDSSPFIRMLQKKIAANKTNDDFVDLT